MKQSIQLTESAHRSYKIGIDEIVGLKSAMTDVMKPIQALIKSKIYWSEVELEEAEYKSRSGFIPHSHNHGGIQITEIIPKCEEYEFGFLEFASTCGPDGSGCECDDEGHLSAKLAVWLKFEGIDGDGNLSFYLILHGGNNDAPYFRDSNDIFEAEFTCKSVSGLKRASAKHVRKLLEVMR
jgi:hypothetical protein